ncbi:FAD-dependent oxidoreductase [Aquimarina sp. 2201CG1-2-11]|uniref:FAD-dependent oxidoreductase n=1 Tax=Aquimarina discodermiae TaxID=3231043 RepID=UPI003462B3F7
MFKFVYKMFGEGSAAIPKSGIAGIPNELISKLNHTAFHYNTRVSTVEEGVIVLEKEEKIESHFTIIATNPDLIKANLKNQQLSWKSCDTLYFETETRVINKPLIGLLAAKGALINNICYHTALQTASHSKKELLSVTIIKKHNLDEQTLIEQVKDELKRYCKISTNRFLKRYSINKALPDLTNIQYEMLPSETKLTSTIFIAGDQQLNGSLNAAMVSGEKAALGVIESLENR